MKYLNFVECASDGRKTKVWMVRNTQGEDLGAVHFRSPWRKYVFGTLPSEASADFDHVCLLEIATFCREQTQAWRESLESL